MESPNVDAALRFSAEQHRGQVREGESALPYLTHPVEVLCLLRYEGGITNPEVLCAGLLHDVIEETNATIETVVSLFGARVGALVAELTREQIDESSLENLSKPEIWRKKADLQIAEIREMSPDAQIIKLADRISNLREAKRIKAGKKLERYIWQTERFLDTIPPERNRNLWKLLRETTR